jgi:hypothetical protein
MEKTRGSENIVSQPHPHTVQKHKNQELLYEAVLNVSKNQHIKQQEHVTVTIYKQSYLQQFGNAISGTYSKSTTPISITVATQCSFLDRTRVSNKLMTI